MKPETTGATPYRARSVFAGPVRQTLAAATLALTLLAGAALAPGCSGGRDGTGAYEFGGQWTVELSYTSNTCSSTTERQWSEEFMITQAGTAITVVDGMGRTYTGTCDPLKGTFHAESVENYGTSVESVTLEGAFSDAWTMSGTQIRKSGYTETWEWHCETWSSWTAVPSFSGL